LRYIGPAEEALLEAYAMYKNGYLPNAGGWMDQPTRFIESVFVIESYIKKLQVKDQDNV
jgi:hypothetical protein